MSTREKLNDDGWYGAPWAEFFLSLLIAKTIQAVWFPGAWMVLLLPAVWITLHLLIGNWIKEHAKKDLLGKE